MYAIGIDIGTTSICGVVVDTESGAVVKSCTEASNAFIPSEQPWEKIQDTERIIALALEILESLLEYPAAVIGLTGQMHGIVYVNEDGKSVSPLYTWQDERGNQPYGDTTYASYMGSFAGYGNVTDFYNKVNGIRPKEAAAHCTIMDYLGMVLCGTKVPKIHTTNAASLGCFDLLTKVFYYEVHAEICDSYDLIGFYKGIPVSVAIGDNQASVFSTLTNEEDILLNVGTGSQVSIISNCIKEEGNIETRPYFEGKYLIVGAALCGGRAYSLLKEFYQKILSAAGLVDVDIYALMEGLLVFADIDNGGLKVDTRFAGTRKEPELFGQINGITVNNFNPANITRGFLQGMMTELYDMYVKMGEKRLNLVGSGNGIRKNKTLIQIAEKQFGGQLKIPVHMEEAAYGAALYGAVASGIFENSRQAQALTQYKI